jgi:hypothetical protein
MPHLVPRQTDMKLDIKIIYALIWVLDGERRLPDDLDTGGAEQYVGRRTPEGWSAAPIGEGVEPKTYADQSSRRSGVEMLESHQTVR